MKLKERIFTDYKTGKAFDYNKWFHESGIHHLFGESEMDQTENIADKTERNRQASVDQKNEVPFPVEFDDLTRLHFLVRNRKATTVIEFGVGKSTRVIADALKKNSEEYGDFVRENLRRANLFELHSVDSMEKWLNVTKDSLPNSLKDTVKFHLTDVEMTKFNGRPCTMYNKLPDVCPDIIYLDAPDQFSVKGDVRGISTRVKDRLPMAADVLLYEPFLLPGALVVVDGRTANVRFLLNNLQRNWEYCHFEDEDVHILELVEKPYGKINKMQLDFSNIKY